MKKTNAEDLVGLGEIRWNFRDSEKLISSKGIDMRQHFAGLALQGYCMSHGVHYGASYLAEAAVAAADALIKALNEEQE